MLWLKTGIWALPFTIPSIYITVKKKKKKGKKGRKGKKERERKGREKKKSRAE